jgi:hypothetical protein
MSNLDIASYNRQGKVFHACNAAGVILTAVGTVVTGLTLSNPFGSGKKVILIQATFMPTTVPAATYVAGLAVGYSPTAVTLTTPVSSYSSDASGKNDAVARVCSSATFPVAVVLARATGYAPTTPATTGGVGMVDMEDGGIVLSPGGYCVVSMVGTAPTGITSYSWIEVPA